MMSTINRGNGYDAFFFKSKLTYSACLKKINECALRKIV